MSDTYKIDRNQRTTAFDQYKAYVAANEQVSTVDENDNAENSAKATYDQFWNATTLQPASANATIQTFNIPLNTRANAHKLQERFIEINADFEMALKDASIDFEKLQRAIFDVIRFHMQDMAKSHHEYLSNMRSKIVATAQLIKETHNNKWGMAINIGAAALSVGVAGAGFAFLLPASVISVGAAASLSRASMSASGLSSSLGSLASIPNGKQDGIRGVLQIDLKRMEERESERKDTKRNDSETKNRARDNADGFERNRREAMSTVLSH